MITKVSIAVRGKSARPLPTCFKHYQLDDKPRVYKIEAAFNESSTYSATLQEIAAAFVNDELPSVVL
jgi:hypothetical protein